MSAEMIFTWSLTAASIIGTVANIYKKQWCFIIWLFTNTTWMIVDFYKGIYAQSFLFLVYTLLAIWGLIQWTKK
jgi:nicotinamide riboside transporter PnuC